MGNFFPFLDREFETFMKIPSAFDFLKDDGNLRKDLDYHGFTAFDEIWHKSCSIHPIVYILPYRGGLQI